MSFWEALVKVIRKVVAAIEKFSDFASKRAENFEKFAEMVSFEGSEWVPDFGVPEVEMPGAEPSGGGFPSVEIPDVEIPDVEVPSFSVQRRSRRKKRRGRK